VLLEQPPVQSVVLLERGTTDHGEHEAPGLVDGASTREGVCQARGHMRVMTEAKVRASQQRDGVAGAVEARVEEVPEVVEVRWLFRGEHERALVGGDGVSVIAEERLGEPDEPPREVVSGVLVDHATREERGAPWLAVDHEASELPRRERPGLGARLGQLRQLLEEGPPNAGARLGALDALEERIDVIASSSSHTCGCTDPRGNSLP